MGICGALLLLIQAIVISWQQRSCRSWWCVQEVCVAVSVAPCLWYMFKMFRSSDEKIRAKEAEIAEKKKELAVTYNSLIASVDDLLGKAAESSATLAERSFESKRRDFNRFLERAESRCAALGLTGSDRDVMLREFRRFVKRWLVVFEECSVDPVAHPKVVVSDEELDRCTSIDELSKLVLERLKLTEVRFVTSQRQRDVKIVQGFGSIKGKLLALPDAAAPMELKRSPSISSMASDSFQSQLAPPPVPERGSCCPCTWWECGSGHKRDVDAQSGWPRQLSCGCCTLSILSRDHTILILGFLTGCVIFGLEFTIHSGSHALTLGATVFYEICLVVILVVFEDVDAVAKLDKDVEELSRESERIADRRQQMHEYWGAMQNMTDLWLHRTIPRLELLKEVQGYLEDAPDQDVLPFMANANARLEDLEKYTGALTHWRNDGEMSEDLKKKFAERVTKICYEDNLPTMLHNMQDMVQEGDIQLEFARAGDPKSIMPAAGLPPLSLPRDQQPDIRKGSSREPAPSQSFGAPPSSSFGGPPAGSFRR